jgi:ABC-2 type transport system ATP-binding protein
VFFSSHILSEVQRLCNRVALIKDGRIIRMEKMSELQENNFKRITIESKSVLSGVTFAIPGVSDLAIHGKSASFIFKGSINAMIHRISGLDLVNVSITEPDLEEIFLHYYAKEE